MSFIQIIRDFFEVINNSYGSGVAQLPPNDINFQKIIEIAFIFCLQNIKFIIFNFFSFEWAAFLGEVSQFQIFVPKVSESILRETFFLENYNPIHIIFDTYNLNTNKFFIGFLNGFFLSLPFSCSHFIFLRRLLVQGRVAGIAASLGNICGQILFIASIMLGIRVFIIPFFSFQPLVYISGTFLLLTAIYTMVHEKSIKIIKETDTKQILQIFLLNFFLIWTEQSCIYQFFTNISVGPEPTLLESFEPFSSFLFIHFIYLIGLFFGAIFFNSIIGFLLENGSEYIQIRLKILKSSWVLGTNFILLSSILTLTFTSIPYYTIDYLLTSQFGFISQDKAFKNTIFSENNLIDSIGFLGSLSLNTDKANFDRGFYLNKPGYESFEELNYSGEYATFIQQGLVNDEYKAKAKKFTSFFLKKTKTEENQPTGTDSFVENKEENFRSLREEPQNFDNFFKYPTYFIVDKNFSPFIYLDRRFQNNYKKLSNGSFFILLEKTLNRFFFKGVLIISNPEVDKKIKQKYYSNPVYKFLLNIDIDLFLKRQFHKINGKEEKELHQKRLLVTRYNDTLRFYNLLPYSEEFQFLFNGTKSFADRVYNQQFKGTLRIVRRLFSISFFSNPMDKGILKYDQPFFLNPPSGRSATSSRSQTGSPPSAQNLEPLGFTFGAEVGDEVGGRGQSSRSTKQGAGTQGTRHDFYHEELAFESGAEGGDEVGGGQLAPEVRNKPFIEIMNGDPFYIGWDANLRKIIVTNRMVAKKTAIFENQRAFSDVDSASTTTQSERTTENSLDPAGNQRVSGPLRSQASQKILFSTWPVLEKDIKSTNKVLFKTKKDMQNKKLNYNLLFKYVDYQSGVSFYKSLPSNLENLELNGFDILPPNRGGFVWPGMEIPFEWPQRPLQNSTTS